MALEDPRTFAITYRTENLSAVARQRCCTQGTVAQHVWRLEKGLGAELFTRTGRGVEPTTADHTRYEGANKALGNMPPRIDLCDGMMRLCERQWRPNARRGFTASNLSVDRAAPRLLSTLQPPRWNRRRQFFVSVPRCAGACLPS